MSQRKQAAFHILSLSPELRRKVLPYIDLNCQTINFDKCLRQQELSPELLATVFWIRAIWTGSSHGVDLMDISTSLDPKARTLILRALKTLWNV